ncbi:hypothetical protein BBJ28_00015177 [Nothophytophthora sp. Chile5]|nr:hypothetical protein BBJ28_00015177 [Nothophytophthora sp. Chile5]
MTSRGFSSLQSGSDRSNSSRFEPGSVSADVPPVGTVEGPSSPSSARGSRLSDGQLGVVVGAALLLAVMVSILFISTKRRRRMEKDLPLPASPRISETVSGPFPAPLDDAQQLYVLEAGGSPTTPASFRSRVSSYLQREPTVATSCSSWRHPEVVAVRIAVSELNLDELVARGANSEVYRGQYRGQLAAIKKPLPQWLGNRQNLDAFFSRVRTLASPALTHPGIVSFLGVSWRSLVYVCMVSEFMAGGDLRSFLDRRLRQAALQRDVFERRGFGRQKVCVASQVASALSFLHAQGLVHGAVRSRNVLLDNQLNAKLTGFQGSSPTDTASRRHSHELFSPAAPARLRATSLAIGMAADRLRRTRNRADGLWSAPEVLRGERCTSQADVFAFGVVLAELDSHAAPYAHVTRQDEHAGSAVLLEKVAAGHLRVHFSSSRRARRGRNASAVPVPVGFRHSRAAHPATTAAVVRLGKACVALDPQARPSAAHVSAELHKILQTLEPHRPQA